MGAPSGCAPIPARARAAVGPASNDRTDPGGARGPAEARAGSGAFGSLGTPWPRFRRIVANGKGGARRASGAATVCGVGE